jgi:hypothetical protein
MPSGRTPRARMGVSRRTISSRRPGGFQEPVGRTRRLGHLFHPSEGRRWRDVPRPRPGVSRLQLHDRSRSRTCADGRSSWTRRAVRWSARPRTVPRSRPRSRHSCGRGSPGRSLALAGSALSPCTLPRARRESVRIPPAHDPPPKHTGGHGRDARPLNRQLRLKRRGTSARRARRHVHHQPGNRGRRRCGSGWLRRRLAHQPETIPRRHM